MYNIFVYQVFDNYAVTVMIGGEPFTLGLFDTAGKSIWQRKKLRKLIHYLLYVSIMAGVKVFKLQPLRILHRGQLLNKLACDCCVLPDFKLRIAGLSSYQLI